MNRTCHSPLDTEIESFARLKANGRSVKVKEFDCIKISHSARQNKNVAQLLWRTKYTFKANSLTHESK